MTLQQVVPWEIQAHKLVLMTQAPLLLELASHGDTTVVVELPGLAKDIYTTSAPLIST